MFASLPRALRRALLPTAAAVSTALASATPAVPAAEPPEETRGRSDASSSPPAGLPRSSPSAGAPNPLNPYAAVPPVTYTPSLSRYRPAGDAAPIPWREANDTVARIGGWRAYAREAQAPAAAASAASGPAPGHGAHHGH